MEITDIYIKYLQLGSLDCENINGLCHIKSLPYLSIVQSNEGTYQIQLNNKEIYSTQENGFFIAPSNTKQTIVHFINPITQKMKARWLFLDVEVNHLYPLDTIYSFDVTFQNERIVQLFNSIFDDNNPCQRMIHCFLLLKELLKLGHKKEILDNENIYKSLKYMHDHYMEKLTITQLAKKHSLSESNYFLQFKKAFHTSPMNYLNQYRLHMASLMLINSSLTLKEISQNVGYEDSLYFSKAFKNNFGVSPSEYRKQSLKMK